MDVFGFLVQHGIAGVNSLLLLVLFYIIRSKMIEIDQKLTALWEWHLAQKAIQAEKRRRKDQDEDD